MLPAQALVNFNVDPFAVKSSSKVYQIKNVMIHLYLHSLKCCSISERTHITKIDLLTMKFKTMVRCPARKKLTQLTTTQQVCTASEDAQGVKQLNIVGRQRLKFF